jgi:hypothetical protein
MAQYLKLVLTVLAVLAVAGIPALAQSVPEELPPTAELIPSLPTAEVCAEINDDAVLIQPSTIIQYGTEEVLVAECEIVSPAPELASLAG